MHNIVDNFGGSTAVPGARVNSRLPYEPPSSTSPIDQSWMASTRPLLIPSLRQAVELRRFPCRWCPVCHRERGGDVRPTGPAFSRSPRHLPAASNSPCNNHVGPSPLAIACGTENLGEIHIARFPELVSRRQYRGPGRNGRQGWPSSLSADWILSTDA